MSSREVLLDSNRSGSTTSFAQELAFRTWMAFGVKPTSRMTALPDIRNASAYYIGKDITGAPMYRVSYSIGTGARRTQTVAYNSETRGVFAPKLSGATGGIDSDLNITGPAGSGSNLLLQRKKDEWLSWVMDNRNQLLSGVDQLEMARMIRDWQGSPEALDKQMRFIEANIPVSTTGIPEWQYGDLDPGAGGGGGGGFAGPQYVAPDRRVVEDYVKGVLVSLVGHIPDDAMVQQFTDLYMSDHRRNWDTPDQEIDPGQSVVEAVRQTNQYQTIHQLRPDSEDERAWVAQRRGAAQAGGLNVDQQEDFAIEQATVGGDVEDTRRAASMRQLQTTGAAPTILDNQFREVVNQMFQGVRR